MPLGHQLPIDFITNKNVLLNEFDTVIIPRFCHSEAGFYAPDGTRSVLRWDTSHKGYLVIMSDFIQSIFNIFIKSLCLQIAPIDKSGAKRQFGKSSLARDMQRHPFEGSYYRILHRQCLRLHLFNSLPG